MLPFHKYLSIASTQEGREKETRSPGVWAKNTHELYIQNGTPIVLEHKFSVCRAVLLCRLQALQLDKHPNRPGLARQKHPMNVLSRVNVQELGTNVFILIIPGRSSSLCLLPSLWQETGFEFVWTLKTVQSRAVTLKLPLSTMLSLFWCVSE